MDAPRAEGSAAAPAGDRRDRRCRGPHPAHWRSGEPVCCEWRFVKGNPCRLFHAWLAPADPSALAAWPNFLRRRVARAVCPPGGGGSRVEQPLALWRRRAKALPKRGPASRVECRENGAAAARLPDGTVAVGAPPRRGHRRTRHDQPLACQRRPLSSVWCSGMKFPTSPLWTLIFLADRSWPDARARCSPVRPPPRRVLLAGHS